MRVAVMQPYFVPYAGYFRLFSAADRFIAFDCVQFPRRGWVHRNMLPDAEGRPGWLTLPLRKAEREARIADLAFREDAPATMHERMRRFPCLQARGGRTDPLVRAVEEAGGDVVDYLLRLLRLSCERLDLPFDVIRSSELGLDPALRGAARIRAAMAAVGATEYVNAPGGRGLYSGDDFARHGKALRFLPPYDGPKDSILHRLLTERPADVAAEIRGQVRLEEPDD